MSDKPPIYLHNSLTGKKEEFIPQDEKKVRMYVCGPTVYAPPHIGNMRPVVVFDVLYRLLRWKYGADHVTYVRNITDVDDKIIEAARERKVDIGVLTKEVEKEFNDECEKLGALPPDETPHATDYIPQMQDLVKRLLDKGVAYQAGGEVLFDISKYPNYGELSGRKLEDQKAGARVAVADHKRNAGDFVLWKPAKDDEPGWDSPWGRGRPGWHLECSAMSYSHFGESFDIHGGGQDLLFPHHENERAQTCAAFGSNKEMASVWMHNGYVLSGGKKMAKSEGNILMPNNLLPEKPSYSQPSEGIVRWLLLASHYRQPLDISEHSIETAMSEWIILYRTIMYSLNDFSSEDSANFWEQAKKMPPDPQMLEALCDDLNTPLAMERLRTIAKEIGEAYRQKNLSESSMQNFISSIRLFEPLPNGTEFIWRIHRGENYTERQRIIDKLLQRQAARKAKNWELADKIRKELLEEGIEIEDTKDGIRWLSFDVDGDDRYFSDSGFITIKK